ncbi:anti-sigma factor [Bradyrhizobium diazoefficiens]|nr:anti-sigma factor [Bradyrhizobium diazoefficiens]MBR0851607.1 anti-sigma factor [Bradyrhizobium diazoefficiens]
MTTMPPTEEELHAYLDGNLPQDRRTVVEQHLSSHPEDAERLEAYRADGEAIKRLFSGAGRTVPVPAPFVRRRAIGMPAYWRRVAVIALTLAGLVAGGMLWHHRGEDTRWARLGNDAIAAHLALETPQSAPAMTASLPAISRFLTDSIGQSRILKESADPAYTLVGSRLWTSADGPVAQLSFRLADGNLVTMLLQPWPRATDTPFRQVAQQSDLTTLAWVDDKIFCAVSGALPPAELERIARSIYELILS